MTMIHRLCSKHYRIHQLFVTPADQGFDGTARERTYVVMTRKHSVAQIYNLDKLYDEVTAYIRKVVRGTEPKGLLDCGAKGHHLGSS